MRYLHSIVVGLVFVAAVSATARAEWILSGLEIVRAPAPVADVTRIKRQQSLGCAATTVQFGDTAFMRGFALGGGFPEPVRRLMAAAEMTDDREAAYSRYRAAMSVPELTAPQRSAVRSQWILAALQFGDQATVERLDAAASAGTLPPRMRADRIFWSVLHREAGADADLARQLDADLTEAQRLDPGNFSVRAWRVFLWLKWAAPSVRAAQCVPAYKELQRRVLDVSEASPCPIMIGHFDHALSRFLQSAPETGIGGPERAWHVLAAGLLAEVAQNRPRVDALTRLLSNRYNSGACQALMLSGLDQMRGARQ